MYRGVVRWLAAGTVVASCTGSADDGADSTAAVTTPGTAPATARSSSDAALGSSDDPMTPDVGEFCTRYADLGGEKPALYVGSSEHLADIESLREVAPDAIVDEVTTFRDYLASGAIDSVDDPESNLVENWPSDVAEAADAAQAFGAENC